MDGLWIKLRAMLSTSTGGEFENTKRARFARQISDYKITDFNSNKQARTGVLKIKIYRCWTPIKSE